MRIQSLASLILFGVLIGAVHCGQGTLAGNEQPEARRPRMSIDVARHQAELLHDTIHATLRTVHHDFYREDEGLPIPAASLKKSTLR